MRIYLINVHKKTVNREHVVALSEQNGGKTMSDRQKLLAKIIFLFILLALYYYSFLAEIGFCFHYQCSELDSYKTITIICAMPFLFTGLYRLWFWRASEISWKAFFKLLLVFIAFALINGACWITIVMRYMP